MAEKTPVSVRLRETWPQVWELVKPRRTILLFGLILMVINRVAGLVLPASTKYLIDDVIGKRHVDMLLPLLGIVMLATTIQGVTSFSLTQLISRAGQKVIAEMRIKVQAHVGRLSLSSA